MTESLPFLFEARIVTLFLLAVFLCASFVSRRALS
jgi:hypothetical protein